MLRELSLFSGIGGFSLGLERAGFATPVAFVEIDPFCQRVLAKHWPGVPIHGDVTTREFIEGEADVITGGFPCQDVSCAGKRAGLSGASSGLYRELVRAIRVVRPRVAIVENVAMLLSDGMGTVLGDLAEVGYDAEWDCFPTGLNFGHRRDRTFIVANPMCERLSQRGDSWPHRINAPHIFARERFAGVLASVDPRKKWSDRPLLGRGISRISSRAHRIKSLGNAVVPQVVEVIGRALASRQDMERAG